MELLFTTEKDANAVLNALKKLLEARTCFSVTDLNELCGLPSTYLDHKSGWGSLDDVESFFSEELGCWVLKFPKPLPIMPVVIHDA